MLAYVFWHWPRPEISNAEYVEKLCAFHDSLATHLPNGFSRSIVFELNKPPWLKANSIAYEDWYLVEDSAALDKLDFAAVSGKNEKPHYEIASHAAGGTAGLYRLRQGHLDALAHSRIALWFSKAQGVRYPDLYSALNPVCAEPGVGLWCRQMTLGPTTEFCLRSDREITLPGGVTNESHSVAVKTIWSSS